MAARAVKLHLGSISHPEFGSIAESLVTEVKLLRFKSSKPKEVHFPFDQGYLDDLAARLRTTYGPFFSNDLDEEIQVKMRACVDNAVRCYCPDVNEPLACLELAAACNVVGIASHETGGELMVPGAEDGAAGSDDDDDDDDDNEGGDEVHMIEYTFSGKILSLLADVLKGETELEDFLAMVPNFHASEANQGTLMGSMIMELLSKPQWNAAPLAARRPVLFEYLANAKATFLAHYDYLHYNRFTAATYRALAPEDNHATLFILEVRALCTGIEVSTDIRDDLLFQRLRTLFGSSVIILDSLFTLEADIENEITLQNNILIEFKHAAERTGQSGSKGVNEPEETLKEMKGILNYWLDTLRGNVADLQVLVEVLPAVFRDEGLRKYLQLMVTTWNGHLSFYEEQQQQRQKKVDKQ